MLKFYSLIFYTLTHFLSLFIILFFQYFFKIKENNVRRNNIRKMGTFIFSNLKIIIKDFTKKNTSVKFCWTFQRIYILFITFIVNKWKIHFICNKKIYIQIFTHLPLGYPSISIPHTYQTPRPRHQNDHPHQQALYSEPHIQPLDSLGYMVENILLGIDL